MDITAFVISQREEAFLGGDHDDYRAQCSRRIHTLRRRLNIATPKGRKYTAKPAITTESLSKNNEYVNLLLLDAERSWATAMAMKAARIEDTTNQAISGSTRRQIISRLNKASIHAGILVDILQGRSTETSNNSLLLLEAQAYHSYLRGTLYFEKGSWEECLRAYAVARIIYEALAAKTKKDVFKDLLSGTIDPSIRYAAYQFKLPRTKPVSEVAIENFPHERKDIRDAVEVLQPEAFNLQEKVAADGQVSQQAAAASINWRTRKVKVEDASISEAIVAAESAESKLASLGKDDWDRLMTSYDDIINARQEVVDATKTAIDEMLRDGVDQSDQRMQALQITRTAVNYALIEWRVGRDRILCGTDDGVGGDSKQGLLKRSKQSKNRKGLKAGASLASLRKMVALYDTILQSLNSISELPGVAGDTGLVQEVKGRIAYFQALRCLAIGRSHAILSKLTDALALFNRAQELSVTASDSIKDAPEGVQSTAPKLEISKAQFKTLTAYLRNLVLQYHGLVELQKHSANQDSENQKSTSIEAPIGLNLDQYPPRDVDLTNLVVYPPKIEPIPVKPLFFDLAWNYVDYPGRTPVGANGVSVGSPTEHVEDKKETKRGWFGFGR